MSSATASDPFGVPSGMVEAARAVALRLVPLAATLALVAAGAPATQVVAQEVGATDAPSSPRDGQQFQDWTLRCGTPGEDQPERCELLQQRVNDQQQVVMLTVIGRISGADQAGMLIILPLGVALRPGIGLAIDGGAPERLPFERCLPQGCRVELVLTPELRARLQAGREATVTFVNHERDGPREVVVPISLYGFTAGIAEVLK